MSIIPFPIPRPALGVLQSVTLHQLFPITDNSLFIEVDDDEILVVERVEPKVGDTVVIAYGSEIDLEICTSECFDHPSIGVVRFSVRRHGIESASYCPHSEKKMVATVYRDAVEL